MTTSADRVRTMLIAEAQKCIGAKYRYGAKPEDAPLAFDCSSFTQYVYDQVGLAIPRSSILQAAQAGTVVSFDADRSEILKPGDLLFMRGVQGHYNDSLFAKPVFKGKQFCIGHVAMYYGQGRVINARSPWGVCVQMLDELQWPRPAYEIILVKRVLA